MQDDNTLINFNKIITKNITIQSYKGNSFFRFDKSVNYTFATCEWPRNLAFTKSRKLLFYQRNIGATFVLLLRQHGIIWHRYWYLFSRFNRFARRTFVFILGQLFNPSFWYISTTKPLKYYLQIIAIHIYFSLRHVFYFQIK